MLDLGQDKELEVKFYMRDLGAVEKRVAALGGTLVQPRTHEYNLRFDTAGGDLAQASSMLRLRRDTNSHLTYKGPSSTLGGVLARQEIEFEVSNFSSAQKFIEALGFASKYVYEKQRTTYDLDGLKVTLDELPYGDFIEIEGPDAGAIRAAADSLELDWEQRLPETYLSIFRRMKELSNFPFNDLTFENFGGIEVDMQRIGIHPADAQISKEK